jgi:hypothetical protein
MATNVILSVSEESLARREAPSVSGGASAPPDKKARSLRTAGERSFAVGSFAPSAQDDKQCHSERKRRISQEARSAECEAPGMATIVILSVSEESLRRREAPSVSGGAPAPPLKKARCVGTARWSTH